MDGGYSHFTSGEHGLDWVYRGRLVCKFVHIDPTRIIAQQLSNLHLVEYFGRSFDIDQRDFFGISFAIRDCE